MCSLKAYESVALDQYRTIRRSEEAFDGQGSPARAAGDGERRSAQRKRYPCLCEVCGVIVNSEVSYRDHIRGKRHRVNMLKKVINSKRNDLVEAKNGVSITTQYDDGKGNVTTQMHLRDITKEVNFKIKSISDVNEDLPPSKPYTNPPRFAAKMKRGEIVNGIELSGSHQPDI
eukprot:XP_011673681.1 PREDICTED: uncharacterized protein LOC105442804 [Strongylocentrotus purpuratus]